MNRIKLMQLVKEVLAENQIVDADATLRALQRAVKSGSEVTVNGQPLFKMPFINLATLQGGGRVQFPRDESLVDVAADILVDGEPLEILYKSSPTPVPKIPTKPFDPSSYSDPESIYYRGGD
jgi:hypothetical protein